MKTNLLLALSATVAIGSSACVTAAVLPGDYPRGSLYTGTNTPHRMMQYAIDAQPHTSDKQGESCATGFLGVAAFGDASVAAAKKAAGITEIHTVEFHETNILALYQQACTQVHGK